MAPKTDPATTQSAKKPTASTASVQSNSTAGATKAAAFHSSKPARMETMTKPSAKSSTGSIGGVKVVPSRSSTLAPTETATKAPTKKTPTSTATTKPASTSTPISAGKPATTSNSSNQNPKPSVSSGSATTNSGRKPPSPPMLSMGNKPGDFWAFGSLTNLLPANQRNLKAVFAAVRTKPPAPVVHPAWRDAKKK